jgi:hypothetical protein
VKIYAATVEALKKKERQGETEFTTKTEVPHPSNAKFFFFWVGFYFFEFHPIYDQIQGSSIVFFTLQNILLYISLMTILFCKII